MSNILKFYSGQSVFITGVTGFMGKVLLEKILRCMPDIKTIYVLIRPRQGVTPMERIQKLFKDRPFTLNNIEQSQFGKVIAVSGDVTDDNLGISAEAREEIVREVSIVLHLAASVRFDLSLKEAVRQNVIGTKAVLELCEEMKNLKSIVHLSTAYCNVDQDDVEETVYDVPNTTPYNVMEAVKWVPEKEMLTIQDKLIAPHPNTYTYTKRLAEILVKDAGSKLPLVIVRPSIVLASFKEPAPGWTDSWYGPTGIFIANGKGVLQINCCDRQTYPEGIPVDIAINQMIMASYVRGTQPFSETPVYNATQTYDYKYTWGDVIDSFLEYNRKMPFKQVLWHPNSYSTKSQFVYNCLAVFLHFFPAVIIDFLLIMFLQEPFLMKVHRRLHQGQKLMAFFTTRSFQFRTEKMEKLTEYFNDEDLRVFYAVDRKLNIPQYFLDCFLGARKYLVKDMADTSTLMVVRYYIYYIMDTLLKLWLTYKFSSMLLQLVYFIVM